MSWTEKGLKNPAAVIVMTIIVLLLGVLSVNKLPVQLFPDIDKPQLVIETAWIGSSPKEIESEINVPIEDVLRGTPGLTRMMSIAPPNVSFINLFFDIETDMDKVLLEIIGRLNRLPPMPNDSEPPRIIVGGWDNTSTALIEFFVQLESSTAGTISDHRKFIKDYVVPKLEVQYGVASVELEDSSNSGNQLLITIDPYKAADLGIDITQLSGKIGRPNDISGGFVDIGRRSYTLRFRGRYGVKDLSNLVLDWRSDSAIRLGDIAQISVGASEKEGFIFQNGNPAIRLAVKKQNGANVLKALTGLKNVVNELNNGILAKKQLKIRDSFDPSVFINRSIQLLTSNFILGIVFSVLSLWFFLRRIKATLLIAVATPVSILATFVVLNLAGRSLNVISLAGLAFASGMVLDAAIVVLENIFRLREKGFNKNEASLRGASEVWGALLASTATTIAIFIPILFLKDAEGQLFADLALTIAIGVGISLIVAVTVLPVIANYWIEDLSNQTNNKSWDRFADKILTLTNTKSRQLQWVIGLILVSVTVVVLLFPTLNYLPPVKRDSIDAWVFLPPGSNVHTAENEIAKVIMERLEPHLRGEKKPYLKDFYIDSWPAVVGMTVGARARNADDVDAVKALIENEVLKGFPDIFFFAQQLSLFGDFSSNDSVEMDIQTHDLAALKQAAIKGMELIQQLIPGAPVNPRPDPFLASPEIEFLPNDNRLEEVGWSREQLAGIVRTVGSGFWLGEYFNGDERLDVVMKMKNSKSPQSFKNLPLYSEDAGVVPLSELAEIKENIGPGVIMRFNGLRGSSLIISPPKNMSLEELINILKNKVEPEIMKLLPEGSSVNYGGNAGDLERAIASLSINFIFALILLFLIMSALFKSVVDSLLVIMSIPLAGLGGILALQVLNIFTFQPMDLLTMIGFIILLGLVVNNAILLVVQTRKGEVKGLTQADAIKSALRLRLRPILMSTVTSIFGMLPLLLIPGQGSAIYRGMAAAIVGGMFVSMFLSLLFLPSLLQLVPHNMIKLYTTHNKIRHN